MDKPKLLHAETQKRRYTANCVPFISFRHQYVSKCVLKLNIAILCKYQSTIYIIFIQMKSVIGQLKFTQGRNEKRKTIMSNHILHP